MYTLFTYKYLFTSQFCKNFRVGERCCEFECLDPPGEDTRYRERQRLRALILAGNSSAPHTRPSMKIKAGISLLAVAVARFVWNYKEQLGALILIRGIDRQLCRNYLLFDQYTVYSPKEIFLHYLKGPPLCKLAKIITKQLY